MDARRGSFAGVCAAISGAVWRRDRSTGPAAWRGGHGMRDRDSIESLERCERRRRARTCEEASERSAPSRESRGGGSCKGADGPDAACLEKLRGRGGSRKSANCPTAKWPSAFWLTVAVAEDPVREGQDVHGELHAAA